MSDNNFILENAKIEDEKLTRLKQRVDLKTRQVSRKLEEINYHINEISIAFENIIELYQKASKEGDEVAEIVLARIAKKYHDRFDIWSLFIREDVEAVAEIVKRETKGYKQRT